MGLADSIVTVSDEWKGVLGEIAPQSHIAALRNCVDIGSFPSRDARTELARPTGLFLGSVGVQKGVYDLVEAMGLIRTLECPILLWIAGDEAQRGDLAQVRDRIADLGLEDTCLLLGVVQGHEKMQLLSEASFLVLPSYQEGLPIAVVEGMASGLPILATRVGGIPEVVRNGYNGLLVSPGDVEALADKLVLLAANPDLCETMGRRGAEFAAKEFDVEPYVGRLTELYDSVVR
jgi:glycosyltransferase involved in cell wall biosynthesis